MAGTEDYDGRRVIRVRIKRSLESDSEEAETKKVKKNDYLETAEDEEVIHPAAIEYIVKAEEGESSVSQYQEWTNTEYNFEGDGIKNEEVIVPIFISGEHQDNSAPELGNEILQYCPSTAKRRPEKNYHCVEASCTASFRTQKSLKIHQLSSHGSFHCTRCKFETNCARTLGLHGLQLHSLKIPTSINSSQGEAPVTVIHCFWINCNFKVMKAELIVAHVMKDHLEIPTKSKKILTSLKNVQAPVEPEVPAPVLRTNVYKCFHCDVQVMDSLRNVALHETRNHSTKVNYNLQTVSGKPKNILVCARPGCFWRFAEEEHLVLHILQWHEGVQLNRWEEDELNNANDVINKLVSVKSKGENEDETRFQALSQPTSFEGPSCSDTFSDQCQLGHKLPISDTRIFSEGPNSQFYPNQLTSGTLKSINGANQILETVEPTPKVKQMQAVSSYPNASLIQKPTKDKRRQIEVLSREKVTVLETKPIKFSPKKGPKK